MADHRDGTTMAFERGLIHRAIGDSAFRADLVAHPKDVVQRELVKVRGALAGHQTVQVVEDTATRVFIVLPPRGYAGGGYAPYRLDRGLVQSQFGNVADHRDPRALEFEHVLIHRAIDDGAFRAEFIAQPSTVVHRELVKVQGKLPTGLTVQVIEETPACVYLVLPPHGHVGGYNPYQIGLHGIVLR